MAFSGAAIESPTPCSGVDMSVIAKLVNATDAVLLDPRAATAVAYVARMGKPVEQSFALEFPPNTPEGRDARREIHTELSVSGFRRIGFGRPATNWQDVWYNDDEKTVIAMVEPGEATCFIG